MHKRSSCALIIMTNMDTVDEKSFLAFVAELLNVQTGSLSMDTAYGSIIAWDSIMHMRLVMEIGDRFNVDIPLEMIPELKTLRQFYSLVEKSR